MLRAQILQWSDVAIRMLDLGASGGVDPKWQRLFPILEYAGFEPNAEECHRLNQQKGGFRSQRFLPYAIGDRDGVVPLYTTRNSHCYSLLRPRHPWLKRFRYAHLFEETGQIEVTCTTLDTLHQKQGLTADIIKLDTQGMELPILKTAEQILAQGTFCIETETGFVENYCGETTYAQIDEYLRAKGFLLFDMKIHRMGRANQFTHKGVQQPLWCECIWLRDYLSNESFGIANLLPNREMAFKSLLICEALDCLDYGLELVGFFGEKGIFTREEARQLSDPAVWRGQMNAECLLSNMFLLLPSKIRHYMADIVRKAVDKPHLLRKLWQKPYSA